MTNSIKKRLLNITKRIGYSIWFLLYGRIEKAIDSENHNSIEVLNASLEKGYLYKIFKIKNCRIYTDTVTDTAFIIENKIIKGPSFQHRNPKNADISENIVFQKGTPKIKKKLNGKIFSLLTGGGGNKNYWHWLFDVLPRINILEKHIDINEIDFFLFPDLNERFQKESLDLLDIPSKKRISSIIKIIYSCDIVIGNESGPVCLASSLEKDVHAIYLPVHTKPESKIINKKNRYYNATQLSSSRIIKKIISYC